LTPEERKKLIKDLISRIPTEREKLFEFTVSWEYLDEALMEQRVRPWINKKICEYIGEEEPSLVSFICEKITSRTGPGDILQDLSMVS
jgi:RNA-binding protein 25